MQTYTETATKASANGAPNVFEAQISVFKHARANEPTHTTVISSVLHGIQSGAWRAQIEGLRAILANGDAEKYRAEKMGLNAVTFAGTFERRANTALKTYSGVFHFDIDHVDDAPALKKRLAEDSHTAFAFISPSGNGVKAAFCVAGISNDANFKRAFRAVAAYIQQQYGVPIDESRKDLAGLCFVSYDADLYRNDKTKPFIIPAEPTTAQAQKPTKPQLKATNSAESARALKNIVGILDKSTNGTRHEARLRAARLAGGYVAGGMLAENDAWAALVTASDAIADGGKTNASELKTLKTAFENGTHSPITAEMTATALQSWFERHEPRRIDGVNRTENGQWVNSETGELLPITDADVWAAIENDQAGAGELAARILPEYRFDYTGGQWLFYRDGIYRDDAGHIGKRTRSALQKIFGRYAVLCDDTATQLERADDADDKNAHKWRVKAKAARAAVKRLNRKTFLNNALAFFADEKPCQTSEFDAIPTLFNCQSGVLDLATGALLPHTPEHLHKKRAGAAFNAGADCPFWLSFLRDVFGDDDEITTYLQRRLGLCLSGENGMQDILFFYGVGANGKSALVAALRAIFGGYFTTMSVDVLLNKRYANTDEYHLCRLQGARIVATTEIPHGAGLNESALKNLTGNDAITARQPAGRPFEFEPSHQLFMIGNSKPRVRAQDYGTWRRLRLVPFERVIPEAERKPMPELLRMFLSEADGILFWLYDGYRDAKRIEATGAVLPVPELVKRESENYRAENDTLSDFFEARCVFATEAKESLKKLFDSYSDFCSQTRTFRTYGNTREFASELRRRGHETYKGGENKTFVTGVALLLSV